MQTMTQAAYARLQGVSRKTVTEWKQQGFLRLSGALVDVGASNTVLAAAGRSRLSPATLRPRVTRNTRNGRGACPQCTSAWTPNLARHHAEEHPTACAVSAVIDGSAFDIAEALLPLLPLDTVRPLVEGIIDKMRDGAADLLDEDGPAPVFGTWAAHPWFNRPALSEADWEHFRDNPPAARSG
ncbi:hypothetical protein [Muricoccus radiodurans]|uniref:hypothetical protein n=1 Tax=Muricoccus radiodurans TaxID=2231721 RepID=UPI003CF0C1C7